MFSRYGTVHSATVATRRDSKRSRGFGFVEMHHSRAESAISGLDGASIAGRQLKVRAARGLV